MGLDEMELVNPITWRPDERGKFASEEVRRSIDALGGAD